MRAFEARGLAAKGAYARIVAGRALAALGRPAFARRQAVAALERSSRVPSAAIGWRAQALLADLADDLAERRRNLELAIDEAERLRARIVLDELQAAFQRDKIDLYAALARVFLATPGSADAAFEVLESARSRVLADRLAEDTAMTASAALRQALEELDHLYRRLNEAERDDASRAAAEPIREQIGRREADVRAHQAGGARRRRARRAGPHRRHRVGSDGDPGIGEALVEYAFLGEELHAFAVDRRGLAGPARSRAATRSKRRSAAGCSRPARQPSGELI